MFKAPKQTEDRFRARLHCQSHRRPRFGSLSPTGPKPHEDGLRSIAWACRGARKNLGSTKPRYRPAREHQQHSLAAATRRGGTGQRDDRSAPGSAPKAPSTRLDPLGSATELLVLRNSGGRSENVSFWKENGERKRYRRRQGIKCQFREDD